jgi:hypothetical protein
LGEALAAVNDPTKSPSWQLTIEKGILAGATNYVLTATVSNFLGLASTSELEFDTLPSFSPFVNFR